jgi:hypothetical protein
VDVFPDGRCGSRRTGTSSTSATACGDGPRAVWVSGLLAGAMVVPECEIWGNGRLIDILVAAGTLKDPCGRDVYGARLR